MSMVGITLPVGLFPSAGYHHARLIEGRGDVHGRGNRADRSLGVVNQANELASVGLAYQAQYPRQLWIIVDRRTFVLGACLNYTQPALSQSVDHLLVTSVDPVLGGKVGLPAGQQHPVPAVNQTSAFFFLGKVKVRLGVKQWDIHAGLRAKVVVPGRQEVDVLFCRSWDRAAIAQL